MRYTSTLFFFLFSFLALVSGSHLAAQSVPYEHLKVAKIIVIPKNIPSASHFDKRGLVARLETREGGVFSQQEFDRDLRALAEDYDRVEPVLEEKNDELYITLYVWCNPTISAIYFCGNEKFSNKKLLKELEIGVGDLFDRDSFINAFNKLKLLYVKKGYFEAELEYAIEEVCEGSQIEITVCIQEGRAGRIKRIEFEGLCHQEEVDILQMLVTKRYRFLFSWITGQGVYHHEMIEHDRMTILNYLQNEGYADASVDLYLEEVPGQDRVILLISVDKGALYSFGLTSITGNCVIPLEDIWSHFYFCKDMTFSPEQLRVTLNAIQDLYGSCGYIDAIVDAKLKLKEGECVYDVEVFIEEGSQYRVGLVKVFGNHCTHSSVVLNESLVCPGELFDIRKLDGTERRLLSTGYFGNVNVYPVRSENTYGCDSEFRDVYIEVDETDTGNLSLFFGFSSLDRLFGGVEVSECNFNIKGIPNLLNCGPRILRGGGEYLHMKTNFGDRQTSYLLQWTKPHFLDTPWIVGFDVEKCDNRTLSRGYEIKSYGGHLHATYILNQYMRYAWHYRALQTRNSVSSNSSQVLDQEGAISGFISAIGVGVHYDSTDHPRKPSRGFRSKLSGELAGIGGNFQFLKLGYFNSYYYPMWPRGIMKFRGDLQFIHTFGNTTPKTLPLGERLYLGGDTTVRGYRPYIIGPLFGPNEPRGGVSSLLLSEEYQHHLFSGLDAFLFVDAGYVSLSEFTLGELRSSVGFGFRCGFVPSMPFTVGLGFPYKAPSNETQRFFFAMGGTF